MNQYLKRAVGAGAVSIVLVAATVFTAGDAKSQEATRPTGAVQPHVVTVLIHVRQGSVLYTVGGKSTVLAASGTSYSEPSGGTLTCQRDKSGKVATVDILCMPSTLSNYSRAAPFYVPLRLSGDDIVLRNRNMQAVVVAGGKAGTASFYSPVDGGYVSLRGPVAIRWHPLTSAKSITLRIFSGAGGLVLDSVPITSQQMRVGTVVLANGLVERLRAQRAQDHGAGQSLGFALDSVPGGQIDRVDVSTLSAAADSDLAKALGEWSSRTAGGPDAVYSHFGCASVYLENEMLYDYAVEISTVIDAFPDGEFIANAAHAWSSLGFKSVDQTVPIPVLVREEMERINK